MRCLEGGKLLLCLPDGISFLWVIILIHHPMSLIKPETCVHLGHLQSQADPVLTVRYGEIIYLGFENVCLVVLVHENAQKEAHKEWPKSAAGIRVVLQDI